MIKYQSYRIMKLSKLILLASLFLISQNVLAQDHGQHKDHDMHQMDTAETDTMPDLHMNHNMAQMNHGGMMMGNLPMSRSGSGTSWLPDASRKYGYMFHTDEWMFMVHGNVYVRYINSDIGDAGTRGDEKFGSTNWIMGMAQTKLGENGLFEFSSMFSLEALTIGGAGYPLLFQTGETWEGEPLVDHQHPHDLFGELSVTYTQMFNENTNAFIYLGYPGEPALGPPAFMHRPAGEYSPNSGIGHHWQDATHILFGVATLGFRYKNFMIEGSLFNGTEPNEYRWGFDELNINSWSLRLSYNPTDNLALQVSRGWINDAHPTGPREDVNRTTASIIHAAELSSDVYLTSSAVWGYNDIVRGHHPSSHSFLLESALTVNTTTIFGRFEWVNKDGGSLQLSPTNFTHDEIHELYGVSALAVGVQQKLFNTLNTNVALGVQGRLGFTPENLEQVYGESPLGLQVFLRIYPGRMMH